MQHELSQCAVMSGKRSTDKGLAAKLWASAQGTLNFLEANKHSEHQEIRNVDRQEEHNESNIEIKIDSVFTMPLEAYLTQEPEAKMDIVDKVGKNSENIKIKDGNEHAELNNKQSISSTLKAFVERRIRSQDNPEIGSTESEEHSVPVQLNYDSTPKTSVNDSETLTVKQTVCEPSDSNKIEKNLLCEHSDSNKIEKNLLNCRPCSVVLESIDEYLMGRRRVFYRQWKRRFFKCGEACRIKHVAVKLKQKVKEKKRGRKTRVKTTTEINHVEPFQTDTHENKTNIGKSKITQFRKSIQQKALSKADLLRYKYLKQQHQKVDTNTEIRQKSTSSHAQGCCGDDKLASEDNVKTKTAKKNSINDEKEHAPTIAHIKREVITPDFIKHGESTNSLTDKAAAESGVGKGSINSSTNKATTDTGRGKVETVLKEIKKEKFDPAYDVYDKLTVKITTRHTNKPIKSILKQHTTASEPGTASKPHVTVSKHANTWLPVAASQPRVTVSKQHAGIGKSKDSSHPDHTAATAMDSYKMLKQVLNSRFSGFAKSTTVYKNGKSEIANNNTTNTSSMPVAQTSKGTSSNAPLNVKRYVLLDGKGKPVNVETGGTDSNKVNNSFTTVNTPGTTVLLDGKGKPVNVETGGTDSNKVNNSFTTVNTPGTTVLLDGKGKPVNVETGVKDSNKVNNSFTTVNTPGTTNTLLTLNDKQYQPNIVFKQPLQNLTPLGLSQTLTNVNSQHPSQLQYVSTVPVVQPNTGTQAESQNTTTTGYVLPTGHIIINPTNETKTAIPLQMNSLTHAGVTVSVAGQNYYIPGANASPGGFGNIPSVVVSSSIMPSTLRQNEQRIQFVQPPLPFTPAQPSVMAPVQYVLPSGINQQQMIIPQQKAIMIGNQPYMLVPTVNSQTNGSNATVFIPPNTIKQAANIVKTQTISTENTATQKINPHSTSGEASTSVQSARASSLTKKIQHSDVSSTNSAKDIPSVVQSALSKKTQSSANFTTATKRKPSPSDDVDVITIDDQPVNVVKKHPRKSRPQPREDYDDQTIKRRLLQSSTPTQPVPVKELGSQPLPHKKVDQNSSGCLIPKNPVLPRGIGSWPEGATVEEKKITLPSHILRELEQRPMNEWPMVGQIVQNTKK